MHDITDVTVGEPEMFTLKIESDWRLPIWIGKRLLNPLRTIDAFSRQLTPPPLLPVSTLNVQPGTSYWQRLSIKPVHSCTRNWRPVATVMWVLAAYLSIFELDRSDREKMLPGIFSKTAYNSLILWGRKLKFRLWTEYWILAKMHAFWCGYQSTLM